jgi:hypothetical protein
MLGVAPGEPRHDVAGTQTLPYRVGVITHGRLTRSQDDDAVVRALPAKLG